MKTRLLGTAIAAGLLLAPTAALADPAKVLAKAYTWKPAVLTIEKGDRVVWRNDSAHGHTVTAYSPNWNKDDKLGVIKRSNKTSKIFRQTGVFKYLCKYHAGFGFEGDECGGMCGKIKVLAPAET